ncbi:MAG: hypothetical protein RR655_03250 [Raoultibacter sp.]
MSAVENQAFRKADLLKKFEEKGVRGFRAELDEAGWQEDTVAFSDLDELLDFAVAAGGGVVTYDVTFFPVADEAEITKQLGEVSEVLDIQPEVVRETCREEIKEYLALDAKRNVDMPVHNLVEAYAGGTRFVWFGMNEYPKLKNYIFAKLDRNDAKTKKALLTRIRRAQANWMVEDRKMTMR